MAALHNPAFLAWPDAFWQFSSPCLSLRVVVVLAEFSVGLIHALVLLVCAYSILPGFPDAIHVLSHVMWVCVCCWQFKSLMCLLCAALLSCVPCFTG